MKIKIAEMYTVERDSKEIVMEERFMYCDPEGRAVDPHDIERATITIMIPRGDFVQVLAADVLTAVENPGKVLTNLGKQV